MKFNILLFIIMGSRICATAASETEVETPDVTNFSYGLFSLLSANSQEPNILISPFSIASALGLILAGATVDSACEKELSSALHVTSHLDLPRLSKLVKSKKSVSLTAANGIWSRGTIKPSYVSTVTEQHAAVASDLPQTYEPIDAFITKKTNGLITNMLGSDDIDPLVVAVLVNAVHFKGDWAKKFDDARTTQGTFTTASGEKRDAMFMHAERNMLIAENVDELQGADILRLDYGDGDNADGDGNGDKKHHPSDYSAFFILPKENGVSSMNGVIQGLAELTTTSTATTTSSGVKHAETSLDSIFHQMRSHNKVSLSLPRFKVEYGVQSLKKELKALGINEVFQEGAGSGGADADGGGVLMEMSDDPKIYLDDVLHKAVMEVTEEGTEAAAATAAVIMTRSLPRPATPMVLDRPFVMLILHMPTGTPLFLARIDDPSFSF